MDEIFPSLFTAYRIAEFNAILQHFQTAVVYSSVVDRREYRDYTQLYPALASQVKRFPHQLLLRGGGAYVVFLNNADRYLERIEEARLPFVLELYPGGGLNLGHPVAEAKLSRVFGSKYFRKVIVTQDLTRQYLLKRGYCRSDQIELVFGVVVPPQLLQASATAKSRYGVDKKMCDICFIANKYTVGGIDKGFDRFLETARILSRDCPEVRFHVVGQFAESDGDLSGLSDKVKFYGHRPTGFFSIFHAGIDLILSPNLPSMLAPGAFDGFPTGCCVEAALCGTAMFTTDELGLNGGRFVEGKEIVIISREPREIADQIRTFIAEPDRLSRLGEAGREKARQLFSLERQMAPRLKVLSELISQGQLGTEIQNRSDSSLRRQSEGLETSVLNNP